MLIDAHGGGLKRNTLPWDIVFWVFLGALVISVGSIVALMVSMR